MEGPVGRNRAPVLSSDFEILHAPSGKPPGEGGCRANPNLRESRRHEAALGGRRRAALVYIYIWKYLSMTGGPDVGGRGRERLHETSWQRDSVRQGAGFYVNADPAGAGARAYGGRRRTNRDHRGDRVDGRSAGGSGDARPRASVRYQQL